MTHTPSYVSSPAAPAQAGYPGPGYPQAPYATLKPYSGKAIAGFVLSLVGVAVVGLIVSILGVKDTKDGEKRGRGLAIAGIVIGALGVIWQLILVVTIFATAAVEAGSGSFA